MGRIENIENLILNIMGKQVMLELEANSTCSILEHMGNDGLQKTTSISSSTASLHVGYYQA